MNVRTLRGRLGVLGLIAAGAVAMLMPSAAQARGDDETVGLTVGERAPKAVIQTIEGEKTQLASLYGDGPLVVTFYRGGWCPFCNRALAKWVDAQSQIEEAGAKWIAISPQKVTGLEDTVDSIGTGLTLYSDPTFAAAEGFGIFYKVPEGTQTKLKQFGINLDQENANGQWQLPHPATFIIDSEGVIRFAEVHVDYKVRTEPADVIAALEDIK